MLLNSGNIKLGFKDIHKLQQTVSIRLPWINENACISKLSSNSIISNLDNNINDKIVFSKVQDIKHSKKYPTGWVSITRN